MFVPKISIAAAVANSKPAKVEAPVSAPPLPQPKPEPQYVPASTPATNLNISVAMDLLQAFSKAGPASVSAPPTEQPPAAHPSNYRTVPCKMYHGPAGRCSRGEFCHFIHDPNFVGRELPPELWRNRRHSFQPPVQDYQGRYGGMPPQYRYMQPPPQPQYPQQYHQPQAQMSIPPPPPPMGPYYAQNPGRPMMYGNNYQMGGGYPPAPAARGPYTGGYRTMPYGQ